MELDELKENLCEIEKILGYDFKDKTLLITAFTHCSYPNECQENLESNERLEFLGDAVLGCIISTHLFKLLQDAQEGKLTQLRSQLVDAGTCQSWVEKLKLQPYLLLSRGENQSLGRGRSAILANLFEALLGAIYLDGGLEAARQFVLSHFKTEIHEAISAPDSNWKALLQNLLQKSHGTAPVYEVIEESGPAHQKHFKVQVKLDDKILGTGEGSSKKEAQQKAAQQALKVSEGPKTS